MGIFFTRIKHHVVGNHVKRIHVKRGTAVVQNRIRAQSFTALKADLRQDKNGGSAFSRCLDRTLL